MEEKINNKRIFRYIPSIIAKMILELDLNDEDVFFNNSLKKYFSSKTQLKTNNNIKSHHNLKNIIEYQSSIQTNEEVFPVEYPLSHSIIMSVKLKGFQDLILSMYLKDKKNQNEKLNCEYIPIIYSKILLQISSILSENGGEIIKCEDFEFIAIWDFSNFEDIRLLPKYQRFYSKHALISAFDIMKKIDNMEIVNNFRLKISIGIEYGESSIYFFGGERKRSDYVIMGETIEGSELCLNQSNPHEIIIGRELNNIFKRRGEIITTHIGTDDKHKNLYKINMEDSDEYELKNFQDFKNIKLKSNYIIMNHKIYKNLSKKVYIFASVLPQGLVKYLDIGEDDNLKELSIITIMTIHILMNLDLIDNSLKIQHLIRDMQKATYLTRGSLLGITKTFNGLMIKCVWGLEPNTFIDESARAITTSFAMKKLIDVYKIKLSIGIATGCCFTGLINVQGNRKIYSILGYKAIISRLLADKANRRNLRNKNNLIIDKNLLTDKFIVYCDKNTVKYSQKWYRFNYINDLYMFTENNKEENSEIILNKMIIDLKKKNLSKSEKKIEKKKEKKRSHTMSIKVNKKKEKKKNEINIEKINNIKNNKYNKNTIKIEEIYIPIEYDEYFFQNSLDPFPLIRTYKHNTHNRKNNTFSFKNYLNNYLNEENNNKDINVKKDINNTDISIRNMSKSVYYSKNQRKSNIIDIPKNQIINRRKSKSKKFMRINTRFDSVLKNEKKNSSKEEKNIYSIINNLKYKENNTEDYKTLLKLKKSQTIFGSKKNLEYLINHMKNVYINKKKQFYLIRGPLGCGKSLLIRKALNNFFGNDNIISEYYFKKNYQFLFCNLLNPLSEILPFNTISFILRKIFLLLKIENHLNDILNLILEFSLDEKIINDINFIINLGKDDINLLYELNNYKKKINNKKNIREKKIDEINNKKENNSVIKKYEGPYLYDNIDLEKINLFFYEMIKIYYKYLKSKCIINNIYLPLIFIIDDIHLSNQHSIEFIKFLYQKIIIEKDNSLYPFILIMIQQTPFNKNFKKKLPIDLDIFLNKYITLNLENNITNKIICLEEGPPYNKIILRNIIIFHFKNFVLKKYGTELKVVDNKILDFLLTKTFNGIPLLAIDLLKNLIKSEKFIQIYSGEFIITSELNDESDILDWNDILIPYIYEKITSNSLNQILNFKEILILKYASIIGTLFDLKILNKINPINNIIKKEDIIKLVEKLNLNYFIELHNEIQIKKNKLICQITFPFLRETLYQKFLIETRAPFHMKLAVIISSKRIKYFSLDDELKFLKKNLINSEANIIDEMNRKRKDIITLKDIIETRKDLSYNNLKILLLKEICHNFYKNKLNNLLEGNIELYRENKSDWIPVYYLINTKNIIFYNQEDEKKNKQNIVPILFFKLNSIFKNIILKDYSNEKHRNNILQISISEDVSIFIPGMHNPRKKINYFFSSEKMKDIYQLEIGINFLKMKVNYDTFASYYGKIKFPLYKLKWFIDEEEKYFINNDIILNTINNNQNKNLGKIKQNNYITIEKLYENSQKIKKNFELLIKSTFGCFLGLVQKNISFIGKNNNKNNKNFLQIPSHIQKSMNKLFNMDISFRKKTSTSLDDSSSENNSSKNNILLFGKKFDENIDEDNNPINIYDNNNKDKEKDKFSLKLDISVINEVKSINEEENININLKQNQIKNNKINIQLNEENNLNNKKNIIKYSEFINKTISFPKKPESTIIKKRNEKDLDEEPLFTESNFNTKNNNISSQDNSTKLSASTNIKAFGDKNTLDSNISNEINNKIIFNLEDNKYKKKSRNTLKRKIIVKSMDNNNNINETININNNNKKLQVKSYDDIYNKKFKFDEDFVPFKKKDKLCKHVNIISNQDNIEETPILTVFKSFKYDCNQYSKYYNYKKLGNEPKYMYVNYYHNNKKIHKSNIFNFHTKKKKE